MNSEEKGRKRSKLRDLIKLVLVALAIAAVVKELRTPKADRTWHGVVLKVVPYDFRKPTMQRFKETVWNPEGPVFTPRLFGVGWGVNVGGAVARVKKSDGRLAKATAAG